VVAMLFLCVTVCVCDVAIRCPPAQLPLQRVQALAAQAGAGSKDLLLGKVAIVTGSSECVCMFMLCSVVTLHFSRLRILCD
jgi:hypothetical protein